VCADAVVGSTPLARVSGLSTILKSTDNEMIEHQKNQSHRLDLDDCVDSSYSASTSILLEFKEIFPLYACSYFLYGLLLGRLTNTCHKIIF